MSKSEQVKQKHHRSYMEGKENLLGLYTKLASDYEQGDPLLTLGPNCTTIHIQMSSSSRPFS